MAVPEGTCYLFEVNEAPKYHLWGNTPYPCPDMVRLLLSEGFFACWVDSDNERHHFIWFWLSWCNFYRLLNAFQPSSWQFEHLLLMPKWQSKAKTDDDVHTNVQTSLVSPAGAADGTFRMIWGQDTGSYACNSKGCLLVRRCYCLKEDSLSPFLVRTRLNSIDQGWKTCRLGESLWFCSCAEWTSPVSTVQHGTWTQFH